MRIILLKAPECKHTQHATRKRPYLIYHLESLNLYLNEQESTNSNAGCYKAA